MSNLRTTRHLEQQSRTIICDGFEKKLRDAFFKKVIPIDALTWQDVPDKDASVLIIESGGKKRRFTLDNFRIIADTEGEIEVIINSLIDNA
jgi:hypothetical protein